MKGKEDLDKSNVQRWSIINITVNNLPRELKKAEIPERRTDIDDYSNWKVFQFGKKHPENYVRYPSLYKFLSEQKSKWFDDSFLILQKEITPELEKKWIEFANKASEILKILIENVKKAWWADDFYEMTNKYREEIVSIFKNNSSYVVNMFWDLVKWYNNWEITEQDINELSQWAELIKYKTPVNEMFCYITWSDKKIMDEKNKFLDSWSNVYVVK